MMDAGLDSIASVELRRRVSSACDVDLPATVAFDFPTIDALAAYVDSKRNATTTQTTSLTTVTITLLTQHYYHHHQQHKQHPKQSITKQQ